jgi:hypothetical protein
MHNSTNAPAQILRRDWAILMFVIFLASAFWGITAHSPDPDNTDSRQYAWTAWHMLHDGVFSQAPKAGPVPSALGREPGFPLYLSLMLRVVPGLDGVRPECLSKAQGCGFKAWRPALFLNGVLIALTGGGVFLLIHALGWGRLPAWLGGGHVWLNGEAAEIRHYVLSDDLAMFLSISLSLALVWAWQKGGWRWIVTGMAAAALSLTKAIFLWLVIPAIAAAVLIIAWRGIIRRLPIKAHCLMIALFTIAYAVPVGGWMARNHDVGGITSISAGRTATALSTREVFNHMTPAQYGAAFIYWTRAMGDSLARRLFPESVWGPFEMGRDTGFYKVGQYRLDPKIAALAQKKGISNARAEKEMAGTMIREILNRPLIHIATTIPLIWRGIWIDEFIIFSFPALLWLFFAKACRDPPLFLALLPGGFSLVFYAAVSLNIPRYQLSAIPALAIAFGIGGACLWQMFKRWRAKKGVARDPIH